MFVGRTRELATISDLGAKVETRGMPGGALIVGNPGMGKSRLLEQARGRLTFHHQFAVVGYETERHVPLAATSGLLRALSGQRDWVATLRAGSSGGDATLEPIRIFEAAYLAIDRLGPILLTIDDLQWVDELSLALCHYLIRATSTSARPLLSLAAARPSAAATTYASSLDRLLGSERFTVLELEPLGRDDGVRLVVGIVRRPTTDSRLGCGSWPPARHSGWMPSREPATTTSIRPTPSLSDCAACPPMRPRCSPRWPSPRDR